MHVICIVLSALTFIYCIVVFWYLHTSYYKLFSPLKAARVFNKIGISISTLLRLVSEHGRPHLRTRLPTGHWLFQFFGDLLGFAGAGPRPWNGLLDNIRQITCYGQSRRHLKAWPWFFLRYRNTLTNLHRSISMPAVCRHDVGHCRNVDNAFVAI